MSDRPRRRLAAIVAADVANYSRLIERDEEGTLATLRAVRHDIVDPLLTEYGGRVANTAGDSLLIEFASVVDAVRCALTIQATMAERNAALADEQRFAFRVGINVGDVVSEGGDLFGDGVNVAARLEGMAEIGGIALADDAYRQIGDRIDIAWRDGGEHALKNIARPVRVWRWPALGAASTPSSTAPAGDQTVPPDRPSIAVLRFDNMSNEGQLDHFCTGLSESLITDLSKSDRLAVASRSASFALAGTAVEPISAARTLGVGFLVEGSAQLLGGRLRVNAQLIDGRTGNHVWADRFDFDSDDLFEAQDTVVEKAVVEIDAALDLGEMARKRRALAGSARAYAVYQKAYSLTVAGTREAVQRARREWNNLREIASSPALALGGLASCDLMEIRYGWAGEVDKAVDCCLELVVEALEMVPDFSFYHGLHSAALLLAGRVDEAVAAGRRAFDLDPTYGNSVGYYAVALMANNDLKTAQRMFQTYRQIMPVPPPHVLCQHALLNFLKGESGVALADLTEIRARDRAGLADVYFAAMAADLDQTRRAEYAVKEGLDKNAYLTTHVIGRSLRAYKAKEACDRFLQLLEKAGLPAD
jgi:adenylate cyclase